MVYQPLPDTNVNTSKRKALINEVFSIPMSVGGLSQCEAQLAGVLEQPYHEATAYVRQQQTAHADETGWMRGNRLKGWLWTFVYDPHVEPTNNLAERIIRQAVLWRKGSIGTQSEWGVRYVERTGGDICGHLVGISTGLTTLKVFYKNRRKR